MARYNFEVTQNPTRVYSVDPRELQVARKEYLPFAQEGKYACNFVESPIAEENPGQNLGNPLAEKYPFLAENAYLLDVLMPHYIASSYLIELEKLQSTFTEEWKEKLEHTSSISEKRNLKGKELARLREALTKILSPLNKEHLINDAHLLTERVDSPEGLLTFFATLQKKVEGEHKKSRLHQTEKDFPRGIQVDGERVVNIADLKHKLSKKGVDHSIIEFLVEYLNQQHLMLGANFVEAKLSNFKKIKNVGFDMAQDDKDMNLNIITGESGEVKVAYKKKVNGYRFSEASNSDAIPNESQLESFLQFKIGRSDRTDSDTYKNLDIEIEACHLDIFNPTVRNLFIDYRLSIVEPKIRLEKPLTANDKLAVKLYVEQLKEPNGDISPDKVTTSTERSLFLLMWNNVKDAEKMFNLLKTHTPTAFFNRSTEAVEYDIKIVLRKYHYSDDVIRDANNFLKLLEMVKKPDIEAIKTELRNPQNRHQLQLCLYSVKDVKKIRQLVEHSEIKNYLNVSLLTHFAVQDKSVAETLLRPSFYERVKFSVRSRFKFTKPGEQLPATQFAQDASSPHLKKIIQAHPSFWSNIFGPLKTGIGRLFRGNNSYRYKLQATELKELIDVKNPRDDSYHKALDHILNDNFLKSTFIHDCPITLKDRVQVFKENQQTTIDILQANRTTWEEIHGELEHQAFYLEDEDLQELYESKLNLAYRRLDLHLLHAAEDLWTDSSPRKGAWSKIPSEKKHLARSALISALEDKPFNVLQSTLGTNYSVPSTIMLAEIFITNPLKDAFAATSFSVERMQEFQAALLSNKKIFSSLFDEPILTTDTAEQIARNKFTVVPQPKEILSDSIRLKRLEHQKQTFAKLLQSLLSNADFNHALQLSPGLNSSMKLVLENPEIKKLITENYNLNKLYKAFPAAPSFTKPEAHTILQELYDNPAFNQLLQEIPLIRNYWGRLLVSARFKSTMSKQSDLFLFGTSWEIIRENNTKLIEMMALLPADSFAKWLDERDDQCEFILEKIFNDPSFYRQFAKLNLDAVQQTLIRKAEVNTSQLKQLMFNCEELGLKYLDSLKGIDTDAESVVIKNFSDFLNALAPIELSLLIAKYPNNLLDIIQKSGLFDQFSDKIMYALNDVNTVIDHSDLQKIKNVNSKLSKKIQELNAENNQLEMEFRSEYKDLTKTENPEVIANNFIIQLEAKESNKDLVLSLLRNRKIMSKLLAGVNSNHKLIQKMANIGTLLSEKSRESSISSAQYGKDLILFIEHIIEKAIIDSQTLENVLINSQIVELANNYARPELLAKLLMLKKVDLKKWTIALDRISEVKPLLEECMPKLSSYKNFGYWLIKQKAKETNILEAIGWDEEERDNALCAILENGEYEINDVISCLQNKNGGSLEKASAVQLSIGEILDKNAMARYIFINKSNRLHDKMITIALDELAINGDSTIAADILSEPYINHILQNSDPKDLYRLLTGLKQLHRPGEHNYIAQKLIAIFCEKEEVCYRLSKSKSLLNYCLSFGMKLDKEAAKLLLLRLFSLPQLPESVPTILTEECWKLFVESEEPQPNQLIRYFIHAMRQQHESNNQTLQKQALDLANSVDAFALMFSTLANPQLQQQLLIMLFNMVKANQDPELVGVLKQQLSRLREAQATLTHITDILSANEVIDLVLADGIVFEVEDEQALPVYHFTEYLARQSTQKFLFLEADAIKIKDLVATYPDLIPELALLAGLDNTIGDAIRKRLCNVDELPGGKNLLSVLMQDSKTPIYQLLSQYPNLFQAWVSSIECDPHLLFVVEESSAEINDRSKLTNVRYLLEKGSANDLLRIIKALGNRVQPKDNELIQILYEILKDNTPQRDGDLIEKIISCFGDSDSQFALIEAVLNGLNAQQITEMLKLSHNDNLNQAFQKYFEARPDHLEAIFSGSDEDLKHFSAYFLINERRMNLYLLINEKLPKSLLTKAIDQALDESKLSARTLISDANANSATLAQIFNYEALGQIRGTKELTPLTTEIFADSDRLCLMLESLPVIHEDLVFCKSIMEQLKNSMPVMRKYYKNYRDTDPLRFTASDKPLTENHFLGYLFILQLILVNTLKDRNWNNQFSSAAYGLYNAYTKSAEKMVVKFDENGTLVYKSEMENPVPLEFAVQYFQARSVFFYIDKELQNLIQEKPGFRDSIMRTVSFSDDGTVSYVSEHMEILHPPASYIQMVLFAYSQNAEILNNPPDGLFEAFLKSVTYVDNKIVFAVSNNNIPSDEDLDLPDEYLAVVQAALRKLATSEEEITDAEKLCMINTLPDLQDLLATNQKLRNNILENICVDANKVVCFQDPHEPVPLEYLNTVYELIEKTYQSEDITQPTSLDKIDNINILAVVESMPKERRDNISTNFDESLKTFILNKLDKTESKYIPDFLLFVAGTAVLEDLLTNETFCQAIYDAVEFTEDTEATESAVVFKLARDLHPDPLPDFFLHIIKLAYETLNKRDELIGISEVEKYKEAYDQYRTQSAQPPQQPDSHQEVKRRVQTLGYPQFVINRFGILPPPIKGTPVTVITTGKKDPFALKTGKGGQLPQIRNIFDQEGILDVEFERHEGKSQHDSRVEVSV